MSELSTEVVELKQALLRGQSFNPLDDKSKWPKAFLKLINPQEEKMTPGARNKQAKDNNASFELAYGKYFPKTKGGMYADLSFINPFLKRNALDFYGGRVTLQV